MTTLSLIPNLHKDLNFPIFSFLNQIDLGIGCQVCRDWNQFCSSDELWTRFPELTAHWIKDVKKNVNLCGVGSYSAICREFEKFTNGLKSEGIIHIRWEGNFECLFPFDGDKKPSINLGVGYGDMDLLNMKPIDHCTKIFMKPLLDKNQNELKKVNPPTVYLGMGPKSSYKQTIMEFNESKPGSEILVQQVDEITNRCIEELKNKLEQYEKMRFYSIIIAYVALGLISYHFLNPYFSGT